jgi:hypothetical protein
MAIEGLYRPLWSDAILEELHRHEQYKLIDCGAEDADALAQADHLVDNMRGATSRTTSPGWPNHPVRTRPGSPPPRWRTGSGRYGC